MGPIAEYDPETQRWRPIPLWIPLTGYAGAPVLVALIVWVVKCL
jgi:hypothetical protein